jgi:putative methyltransferase (TIGR04325 family)
MNFNKFLRLLLPPILLALLKVLMGKPPKSRNLMKGGYHAWRDAVNASTGYDSEIILHKTKDSLYKVKVGEAVYERDTVLFDEIQYSWPLLAGLMWTAAQNNSHLNVLDFGGSLGSSYYQNRTFLSTLDHVRWNIVE